MNSKNKRAGANEPEHQKREQGLDKTLADSFPSSDPPPTIPDPVTEETAQATELNAAENQANQKPAVAGVLGTADRAFRATAQSYLDRAGLNLDLRQLESTIRRKPVQTVAIAAGAGFLVGGGMGTRLGAALLTFFGRKAAKETASNVVSGLVHNATR